VPERIAQYRIVRRIGEGGMGTVFAAHDERLDRPVALKVIRRGSETPVARQRFWQEARAAAPLRDR
jgi:serine/threonine protein kinase